LVTAGVYVLIRFNYIFVFLNLSFFKVLSIFTILLAGVCAFFEGDFKKVVAMSTLRQLGMMMFILCVGVWALSFIHLVVHAFFKSMLFLSTGSLIGQMAGSQDSRFYGRSCLSYSSFLYFLVRVFCLSGFPFFIGFYSKDCIISRASLRLGLFFYYIFIVGCFFTVCYSVRLVSSSYKGFFKAFSFGSYAESLLFFLFCDVTFF